MMFLRVSLTLGCLLALSRAIPLNSTRGRCQYMKEKDYYGKGGFVPECDSDGNYVAQQCCTLTGYCWCVDILSGKEIPNTKAVPGDFQVDCGKEHYCPYDWSQYGSRCFIFIDTPKSWIEAESYCLFEGGNLASIHSDDENHFIQGLTRGYTHEFPEAWIGGQDAIQSCFWMWNDGTRFDYGMWYSDYDVERTEHCLEINHGYMLKWNYAACNETRPFVCVKSHWRTILF
ncbi:ladderlectin-like isoform X5 [Xyrichtys novacula]|uniref:Ladderlectin-like isoform X5 n=1 Tax=Xyrichtys novacula TaxID=13765 RepID=A0AAV1EHU4_XYRNO|nr:ladderlectin-like isoform X5 [Xyrichtys novacula]